MVLCGKQIAKDDESRRGVSPSRATEDTAFYTQAEENTFYTQVKNSP